MSHKSSTVALALAAATAASLPSAVPLPATAATEQVLYSFPHAGTGYPTGRLALHKGSLYGTGSGYNSLRGYSPRYGQVFELAQSNGVWNAKTILHFDGNDGATPTAGLLRSGPGTFFGTTAYGGKYVCYPHQDCGNLFELKHTGSGWAETSIWDFASSKTDGVFPTGDLVMDSSGAIYGTTEYGGAQEWGTVFEFTQSGGIWSEQILYNFPGGTDGAQPVGGLHMDKSGNFFGTTLWGGVNGCGTVFELSQSGGAWSETVLHSFCSGAGDGDNPTAALIEDSAGNLYGTTESGGSYGYGSVFELSNSGGTWTLKLLHAFDASDGYEPSAALRWSGTGTLYGTTYGGGAIGGGNVFELTPSKKVMWSFTVLHSFGAPGDGSNPESAVILDDQGNLYGTTTFGGSTNCQRGCGTVYEITP